MTPSLPSLRLGDYAYELPETAIAKFPVAQRDQAKLLVYRRGTVTDRQFYQLPEQLPPGSQLFFNDTKVIPARLRFSKEATEQGPGAQIEIFLLRPIEPGPVMSQAMAAQGSCAWQCMIGNRRRWKVSQTLRIVLTVRGKATTLWAERSEDRIDRVRFQWDNAEFTFAEIVAASGQVPLPPYLNREATDEDRPRYQTVYSTHEGAVAAPTAGLHFTEAVLHELAKRDISRHYLTLHVSAGTFQPIKDDDVVQHPMHSEQVVVTPENLEALLDAKGPAIAVGTTSLRTLESLYWYGAMLQRQPEAAFRVPKLIPYEYKLNKLPSLQQSVENILKRMQRERLTQLVGETEIFVMPGYKFRVCRGLVTNFHQPKSTLMLLIAALVGQDWRMIYHHALQQNYRFLSYGDSSLLLP